MAELCPVGEEVLEHEWETPVPTRSAERAPCISATINSGKNLKAFCTQATSRGPSYLIRRLTKNMLNWVMGFSGKPGREGPLVF